MRQPIMFQRLLTEWMAMPKVLDNGIVAGYAGREAKPGWAPLKGLSAISDVLPPQAFAVPGFAQEYNKAISKFRRRAAFSAFVSRINKSELEARLEINVMLMTAIVRQQETNKSGM